MTDEQINAAIAEACGWTRVYLGNVWESDPPLPDVLVGKHPHYKMIQPVPRYCNDLNAMHEAEKMLSAKYNSCVRESQWSGYLEWLGYCWENKTSDVFQCVHATSRQRAEAFLRTLGKWEEVQP